jgi:predicted RNase H-like HicB family nuclease
MSVDYTIVIEPAADGGYGAWCPDLPGVVALGDTWDECRDEMRDAVVFHLDGLRAEGYPVPPPTTSAAVVHVPAA